MLSGHYLAETCVIVLCCQTLAQTSRVLEQQDFAITQEVDGSQETAQIDSSITANKVATTLRFTYDAGYRLGPVHPYFRDDYRIVNDIRRLYNYVDRNVLRGLEPMPVLYEMVDRLPADKQGELIGAAIMGSAVNFVSEVVSQQLRRRKLSFVQWQLDRVMVRLSYQSIHARLHLGPFESSYHLQFPALRVYLSRSIGNYYVSNSATWFPMRRVGINFTTYNGRKIIGPRLLTPIGNFAMSYNQDDRAVVSGFDLRRTSSLVVRLLMQDYLDTDAADFIQSEVILRW